MSKTLFILADGTWNSTLQRDRGQFAPTNVAKLARLLQSTERQRVYYDAGVGTEAGWKKYTGGLFGDGLFANVRQAYRFLIEHYQPGDHVFLLGFSRGAFTVRSLAGLVNKVGILRKKYLADLDGAFRLYRSPTNSGPLADPGEQAFLQEYRRYFCHESNQVTFLGVWDTVGYLGVPEQWLNRLVAHRYRFRDTFIPANVRYGFHALALDERRRSFMPTRWKAMDNKPLERFEQRWFVGTHSNVGGGYLDTGLSDITLLWMLEKLRQVVREERLWLHLDEPYLQEKVRPAVNGELRDSRVPPFFWSMLFPATRRALTGHYLNETIDESVFQRMSDSSLGYNPPDENVSRHIPADFRKREAGHEPAEEVE